MKKIYFKLNKSNKLLIYVNKLIEIILIKFKNEKLVYLKIL
jgi:hypothetical protein